MFTKQVLNREFIVFLSSTNHIQIVISYLKKLIYISFIFLTFTFYWSCNTKGKVKSDDILIHNNNSVSKTDKIKLTEYDKKWFRYFDVDGRISKELELYISEKGDTLCWNRKIYHNGILDYSQSNFYEFEGYLEKKDALIKGRITLYPLIEHNLKDTLNYRELTVDFVQKYRDKKKVITFSSRNKNYVDFGFKNNNDTIIGLLSEYRRIHEVNSDSVTVSLSKYPIDNKTQTNNIFIHVNELDKNKR